MKNHFSHKDAIGAARGHFRNSGQKPERISSDSALKALDDLARIDPRLLVSIWYLRASANQIKLFKREWDEWRGKVLGNQRILDDTEPNESDQLLQSASDLQRINSLLDEMQIPRKSENGKPMDTVCRVAYTIGRLESAERLAKSYLSNK